MSNKKRVLFLSIEFYDYTNKIIDAIEKMDLIVDSYVLKYPNNFINRIINKFDKLNSYNKRKMLKQQIRYFNSIQDNHYDIIFVLVGRYLDSRIFENFLKTQLNARKILYLWDDVKRIENYYEINKFFDIIYSFDISDCDIYNLNFLPLFYCDEYVYNNEEKKYDFCFTGFNHSDREIMLSNFLKIFPIEKYQWFGLLKTTRKHYFLECVKKKTLKKPFYIQFRTLSILENARILKSSKIVIDIPHSTQAGLSIRTFEALASNTKIITTNTSIRSYDFYNTNNIYVINRDNFIIDPKFLNKKFIPYSNIKRYSIDNWVRHILEKNILN